MKVKDNLMMIESSVNPRDPTMLDVTTYFVPIPTCRRLSLSNPINDSSAEHVEEEI
jgi:hypothetical protein